MLRGCGWLVGALTCLNPKEPIVCTLERPKAALDYRYLIEDVEDKCKEDSGTVSIELFPL